MNDEFCIMILARGQRPCPRPARWWVRRVVAGGMVTSKVCTVHVGHRKAWAIRSGRPADDMIGVPDR